MRTKGSKGQTATEYMIILAVVIMIALVVVNTIGGFIPGIGGGVKARTSQSYWQDAQISLVAGMSASGNHVLKVRNQMRDKIVITSINLSLSSSNDPVRFYASAPREMTPGQAITFTNDVTFDICRNPGDSFISNVKIVYKDYETDRTFVFTGDGNALAGDCAN